MKKAWIENDTVRDVAHDDPNLIFTPEVAAFYDTDVPDNVYSGATLIDGEWKNIEPIFVFKWDVFSIRSCLTLREKIKWDNDATDAIKTAKVEIALGIKREPLTELFDLS